VISSTKVTSPLYRQWREVNTETGSKTIFSSTWNKHGRVVFEARTRTTLLFKDGSLVLNCTQKAQKLSRHPGPGGPTGCVPGTSWGFQNVCPLCHYLCSEHFHFLPKTQATHLKEWSRKTRLHVAGCWCSRPYGEKRAAETFSETRVTTQHTSNKHCVGTPYRRSNSLVRRKFKIGAKAVGSLSINIWKCKRIAYNHHGLIHHFCIYLKGTETLLSNTSVIEQNH